MDLFKLLGNGAHFNKKQFGHDIELFQVNDRLGDLGLEAAWVKAPFKSPLTHWYHSRAKKPVTRRSELPAMQQLSIPSCDPSC